MENARILLVGDEGISLTMPESLRQHGYDVTVVGSANEALVELTSANFDVLISDLNIGRPGEGFALVSAARRVQAECITLIMTGYPEFDWALEAIRSQVDEYLIKSTPVSTIVELIEQKLHNPKPRTATDTKRIAQVLREEVFEITRRALQSMKSDPGLGAIPLSDEQRIEFLPRMLEDLATMLENSERGLDPPEIIDNAKTRGFKGYRQGYTIPMVAAQVRYVEQSIYEVIHEHMRSLNLSYFMFDLTRLNAGLGIQLEHSLLAFVNVEQRIGREAHR